MTTRAHAPDPDHPWTTSIYAREEAHVRGDRRVGTEHLVLGLLHEPLIGSLLGADLPRARAALDALDRDALGAIGVHRAPRCSAAADVRATPETDPEGGLAGPSSPDTRRQGRVAGGGQADPARPADHRAGGPPPAPRAGTTGPWCSVVRGPRCRSGAFARRSHHAAIRVLTDDGVPNRVARSRC